MKIGIVSNLYPPISRGGAEQIARRIATELYKRGHDVFVFSSMPYEGIRSLFTEQLTARHGENVYRMYPMNLYHVLNDYKFPFLVRALWHVIDTHASFSRKALKRIIEREQPDVILTHNLKGLGLQTARAIRESGVRHVHTLHDIQLSVPSGLLIHGKEKSWLNRSFLRKGYEKQVQKIFGSPDIVISPSRFLAKFYLDRNFFPDSQIEIMPNLVPNLELIERAPLNEGGPLRILFVGQLERHKGILFLLETLNKSNIPFVLHVAGEGSLSEHVDKWVSRDSKVLYHGFVSLKHLFELFALVDVTVVPSLCYENSPTVIYESFKAGIPVIAADIGGVGELIEHGENGFLFEPGNKEALISTLKRFVEHRRQFRENASAITKTVEQFSIKNYIDKLEELIER